MKKLLTALLVVMMLFGCSSTKPEAEKDLLATVKERGKLLIATEGTWAPWTYHNENDELVGFDVEVGQYVAKYLGVEAEFVEGEWDGLLEGVSKGRYDILINGCDYTEERAETFDFSKGYALDRVALIVREDRDDITSFEDLDGKTTANTITSTYAKIAEDFGANVNGVDDLIQTFELLDQRRIDATLNAEMTYIDYMLQMPEAPFKIVAIYDEAYDIAMPVAKGENSASFLAEVNKCIDEMQSNGTLSELSLKYFGRDITK